MKAPSFDLSEPLHYSYIHVSHLVFREHGIDDLLRNPKLKIFEKDLEEIKKLAHNHINQFQDEMICPCCGRKNIINLPEEILQYKLLLDNSNLAKRVGLLFYKEFVSEYKRAFVNRISSFIPEINKVENPDCLILVEGESEEVSIPIIALRQGFVLAKSNIQVYNSGSKQKLLNDFLNFKSKYPNRKMICLLDSDAVKEKNDIERIMRDRKNMYKLVYIKSGTFEEIFDLDLSITILNDLYPDGPPLEQSDFNPEKNFLLNIKRLLFEKKKAEFNKVTFSKAMASKIEKSRIPKEILEVLDAAREFTTKGKFIKK